MVTFYVGRQPDLMCGGSRPLISTRCFGPSIQVDNVDVCAGERDIDALRRAARDGNERARDALASIGDSW